MLRQIDIEELKKIQLDILIAVDDFCSKNNIKYFLSFGTLLGTIRHRGYIPWDDDIDIIMLRDDYNRFLETFNHSYYKVNSIQNNPTYFLAFAKVTDERTVMQEEIVYPTEYGVYIDVFPVDNMPSLEEFKNFQRKKSILNKLATLKIVKVGNHSLVKNMVLRIAHFLLCPLPITWIARKADALCQSYINTPSSMAGVLAPYSNKERWIVRKNLFQKAIMATFEGLQFPIPAAYDEFLTHLYGDYMQLPPEEARVSHHKFNAYWK